MAYPNQKDNFCALIPTLKFPDSVPDSVETPDDLGYTFITRQNHDTATHNAPPGVAANAANRYPECLQALIKP
jgi:hypothetical protein